MTRTARILVWAGAVIAVALGTHILVVLEIPHYVTARTFAKLGAVNTIHHLPRVTAGSEPFMRPNPDVLYSSCPFDLSKGALLVHAVVPKGTYWSVAGYDDIGGNFFAVNDLHAGAPQIDLVVARPGNLPPDKGTGTRFIISPSDKGVILFRTLTGGSRDTAALDATRRKASCTLYPARK